MKIHFTSMLWDEDANAMRPHQFELTVDVTKLPIKVVRRALLNKSGKASALSNAITVKHTGALT